MKHFYLHHILNDVHRGLMKMRLCEIQLLVTVCDSTKNLALGDQVDAILLDLSKAFNNVHHQCLLRKLQYNEVGNKTLSWIQFFLTGRIQQVALEGTLSSSAAVLSGILGDPPKNATHKNYLTHRLEICGMIMHKLKLVCTKYEVIR